MDLEGSGQHAVCTHSATAGLTLNRGHSNKSVPPAPKPATMHLQHH